MNFNETTICDELYNATSLHIHNGAYNIFRFDVISDY